MRYKLDIIDRQMVAILGALERIEIKIDNPLYARNMTATEVLERRVTADESMNKQFTKLLVLHLAKAAERAAITLTMDSVSRSAAYGLQKLAEELMQEVETEES